MVRAVPLIDGLGGPAGYGTNRLPANDDLSSSMLSLSTAFPSGLRFFGGPYYDFWVNTNGNITFAGGQSDYTPGPFPVANRPMIAPYWADVDTRGGVSDHDNAIYWHLSPGRVIVTWHNVGYFDAHDDKKMDFQMILTNALNCGAGDFDVEFRYNRCEWTTGDASGDGMNGFGGTPAQAGFDAGNETDFVEIPGSRSMAILDLCTTSNIGQPGIWHFGVRSGSVSCPGTGTPCQGNLPGACGFGVTQCVGRDIVCSVIGSMSEERCDGIDNDCDGAIDDGDLCASPNVCSNGVCVPPCFEGGCSAGYTCTDQGGCLDSACMGVTCPSGSRCAFGSCIGACDGVVCPHDQQCTSGRCVDLCAVITCGAGEVCDDGRCVPTCPCTVCGEGELCAADGSCTPSGCDLTVCNEGFYCRGGDCLDACAGAVCPEGQGCVRGQCVDGAPPSENFDGGGTEWVPGGPPRGTGPGCACRATPAGDAPPLLWLGLAVLGLALAWRRRR